MYLVSVEIAYTPDACCAYYKLQVSLFRRKRIPTLQPKFDSIPEAMPFPHIVFFLTYFDKL